MNSTCWQCRGERKPRYGVGMGMCHVHFMAWLTEKLKEHGEPAKAQDTIRAAHRIPA